MISPLLFYDGHCPFCHFWVQFLLKYDTKKHFHYATLSGETARLFFEHKGIEVPQSIVLVEENRYFLASRAVFRILKKLGGIFKLGLVFQLLPRPMTDYFYYFIAKNRFVLGKPYDHCFLPIKEHKKRFLD
jgi:predicted DCC family thiol-disulfide oxidoreductase YuxK